MAALLRHQAHRRAEAAAARPAVARAEIERGRVRTEILQLKETYRWPTRPHLKSYRISWEFCANINSRVAAAIAATSFASATASAAASSAASIAAAVARSDGRRNVEIIDNYWRRHKAEKRKGCNNHKNSTRQSQNTHATRKSEHNAQKKTGSV